jgi:stearoyl-CoA desaturase (delta-9 desaturase)
MFKNISKYSWLSFVPFVLIGMITICLLVFGTIPVSYLFLTLIGWSLIAGLGVAVGYHRMFSHNTHPNLPTWKENIILFFGALSGQGSSISWTAIHRGYHHKHTDTEKDLHSPVHGLYHAFFGWATRITENNPGFNLKYAANLLRKPNHVWFHNNQMRILWGVPILVALIDWQVSLMLICLPTCLSLLQDNLVNIFGHVKGVIGYRNFEIEDNSYNNMFFGFLGWGQGWHNNHHHNPAAFDFGVKWWEYDPCKLFLPFLK